MAKRATQSRAARPETAPKRGARGPYTAPNLAIASHMLSAAERISTLTPAAPRRGGPAAPAEAAAGAGLANQLEELRQHTARLSDLLYRIDRVRDADRLARRLDQLVSEVASTSPGRALIEQVARDLERVANDTATEFGAPDAGAALPVEAAAEDTTAEPVAGFFDPVVTKKGLIEAAEAIVGVIRVVLPLLLQLGLA